MTALRPRNGEITEPLRQQRASATEDYVGLAWYLAQAIARGDVNFDKASAELHATAAPTERASLHRAAAAARREREDSLVARLLGTAVAAPE